MTDVRRPTLTADLVTRAAYLTVRHGARPVRTEQVWPGVNLDIDLATGALVGIEIFLPDGGHTDTSSEGDQP